MAMPFARRSFLAGALALPAVRLARAQTVRTIRQVAHENGFRFGSAVDSPIEIPRLRQLYEQECDLITPENVMKMCTTQPRLDEEDFAPFLDLIAWAHASDADVRGHPLIHATSDKPPWICTLAARDPAAARAAMLYRVRRLARRFGRLVVSFDVVNEPIAVWPSDDEPLRDDWLFEGDGIGFIVEAFQIAREEAGEGVELVLNEWILPYDVYMHPARRSACLKMLKRCLDRGAPIDTLGIQSHLVPRNVTRIDHQDGTVEFRPQLRTFDHDEWRCFLDEVEKLGLRIAITELSAPDLFLDGPLELRNRIAAGDVEDYLNVTLQSRCIRDIVCWGLSDADTHYTNEAKLWEDAEEQTGRTIQSVSALPFDDDFAMKPMAEAIMRAMRNAPPRL
ncbi:MAG: endo-1,4-beta-xylanase [Pseudomonadota bacterium]